jgi:O-acetyl-ADP-ribose deacetylase (regulator of RNase III)
MSKITYINGDATQPCGTGKKFIVHCCNDVGGWGQGFVLAISKRWNKPESDYRSWARELSDYPAEMNTFKLGNYRIIPVTSEISVVNMIGQRGFRTVEGVPPVRYDAIENALTRLSSELLQLKLKGEEVSVHAPKFGSDLAGGDWKVIEKIIEDTICSRDIEVVIYNFKASK